MLVRYVFRWATSRASSTAWISPDGSRVGWAALAHAVLETSERLRAGGVGAGDRVVVQMPNGWDAICVALAIDFLAAIESPLDARLPQHEVQSRARRLEAKRVLAAGGALVPPPRVCRPLSPTKLTEALRICQSRLDASLPRIILWTSGTTGNAKGVVLASGAIEANAAGKLRAAPQSADDVRLTVLPLAHAYARTCDFATWLISGGTLSAASGWAGLASTAPLVRPTVMNCVPYIVDKITAGVTDAERGKQRLNQLGLDRLRMIGCGGAAMNAAQFDRLHSLGIAVIQGYGLTEAGPVVCSATPDDGRPGVVGRPIRDTRIRIDATGEVLCRGPGLMSGYWMDEAATAARFCEGWLRTGDRGRIEPDGMLRVLGRVDDVIVLSNGRKVSPEPVERRLAAVPGVRHVVLRSDGVALEALVDAEEGLAAEGLQERFAELLAAELPEYQVRRVHLLSQPLSVERGELTVKGTVRRRVVLEQFERGAGFQPAMSLE